jgi:parallel beta-helix repeat protein
MRYVDQPFARGQLLALVVVLLTGCWLALGGGQASASPVSCGETITADTTLDSDLVNCPNNGIVIGADDITLDLNGHRIDGDGTEFASCRPRREFCDGGVLNDGHDGVTVRGGSVREFRIGVFVGKARHNRVLGISSSSNQFFGFVIAGSARSIVRDSSGNDNPAPDGDGIGVYDSHHVRIIHNSFRRNAQPGMHVANSTDNSIEGNLFSDNEFAIKLEDADRNQVRGNRSVRDDDGILVESGNRNVIARNRVLRSGRQRYGHGIKIGRGRGNLIARNLIARGAPEDGVHVGGHAKQTLLRRNRVRYSTDDGFGIESSTTTLTGNRAMRNADLGIEAVPGVIDGGGNIARNNGNPAQCTNIFCS